MQLVLYIAHECYDRALVDHDGLAVSGLELEAYVLLGYELLGCLSLRIHDHQTCVLSTAEDKQLLGANGAEAGVYLRFEICDVEDDPASA